MNNTNYIMLESTAYNKMILDIAKIVKETYKNEKQEDWISDKETMKLLGVGTTTLQTFRNEDRIIYSKTTTKTIKYSRSSIYNYIESKSNKHN